MDNARANTYRSTTGNRELNVENDDPRVETSREGDKVVEQGENVANVEVNGIYGGQVECHVGSRRGPRRAPVVEVDG